MKTHSRIFGLTAGLLLAFGLLSPASAQTPPDVGFSIGVVCQPGYVLTNTTSGPGCVQEINQATNAQSAESAQSAVTAQTATTATSATTANTALNLDPNAQIDAGNIGGMPNCNDGRVLTKTPQGFECVQVATGSRGFANKAYYKTNNAQWVVPTGVFQVRVTSAAGATEHYRQTGYTSSGWSYSGYHWYSWDGYGNSWGGCDAPWQGKPDGTGCQIWSTSTGCNPQTFTTTAGKAATRTYDVTPGQTFRVTLATVQQNLSLAHPHSLCSNYDKSYQVIADVPETLGTDIYWDARNGEYPGEESATSSMIVEW